MNRIAVDGRSAWIAEGTSSPGKRNEINKLEGFNFREIENAVSHMAKQLWMGAN